MALDLAFEEISVPELPGFSDKLLRKIERLRQRSPELLDMVEQFHGFILPSEKVLPTRSQVRSPGIRQETAIIAIRNSTAFAGFGAGKEASAKSAPKGDIARNTGNATGAGLPLDRVMSSAFRDMLRQHKRKIKSYGAGGDFVAAEFVNFAEIISDLLRVTEDGQVRVTEDNQNRFIEE